MTGLTHLAVSAVIYRRGRLSPPLSFALGFVSHFFLDRLPHYDLNMAANMVIGLAGAWFIWHLTCRDRDYLLPFGALMGVLPDALVLWKVNPWFTSFHNFCHYHGTAATPWLLVVEILTVAGSFWLLSKPEKNGGRFATFS